MMIAMRRIRQTAGVLLCVGLLWLCPLIAGAVTVDSERTGTLCVQLEVTAERSDWSGVEFSLYRIGEILNENGGLRYAVNDSLAPSGVDLNFATAQEAEEGAQRLRRFIQERRLSPQSSQQTDAAGAAVFSGLQPGVFFVQVTDGKEWLTASPFVVAVPHYKNGELLYTVTANPKHELQTSAPRPSPTPPPSNGIPQTGVIRWPIPVFGAGGCLILALGVLLVTRKRRGKRERR